MEVVSGLWECKQPPTIPSCKPSGEKSTNTKWMHSVITFCSNLLCFLEDRSLVVLLFLMFRVKLLLYLIMILYLTEAISCLLRTQEHCASRKETYRWCLTMTWETGNEIEICCSEEVFGDWEEQESWGLVYLVLQAERTMEPIFCRLPSR
jgi:hypothetical protein